MKYLFKLIDQHNTRLNLIWKLFKTSFWDVSSFYHMLGIKEGRLWVFLSFVYVYPALYLAILVSIYPDSFCLVCHRLAFIWLSIQTVRRGMTGGWGEGGMLHKKYQTLKINTKIINLFQIQISYLILFPFKIIPSLKSKPLKSGGKTCKNW